MNLFARKLLHPHLQIAVQLRHPARLALLQSFAEFVDRNPNEMVEELFDPGTRRYRRRGFYTDRIREFSTQVPGSWAQQTARGNVVRSFFIANGYRIPPERPPWL